MDQSWPLLAWFGGITAIATMGGVIVYWLANRDPWPLSTRIGVGLGGAAAGAFAGALLGHVYSIEEPWAVVLTVALAIGLSVALQRHVYGWTHDKEL